MYDYFLFSKLFLIIIGSLILLINLPLLMIGGKFLGKSFAIRTIVTLIFISLFIDLFDKVFDIQPFILENFKF
ncbi:YitT family protein [Campylobacterota bacterium DY0563]